MNQIRINARCGTDKVCVPVILQNVLWRYPVRIPVSYRLPRSFLSVTREQTIIPYRQPHTQPLTFLHKELKCETWSDTLREGHLLSVRKQGAGEGTPSTCTLNIPKQCCNLHLASMKVCQQKFRYTINRHTERNRKNKKVALYRGLTIIGFQLCSVCMDYGILCYLIVTCFLSFALLCSNYAFFIISFVFYLFLSIFCAQNIVKAFRLIKRTCKKYITFPTNLLPQSAPTPCTVFLIQTNSQ